MSARASRHRTAPTSPGLSTYSIVGADPDAGEVGVAVQSKFLACGALVPWAQGGVGVVATQALANVRFGPDGLRLLGDGVDPQTVVDRLVSEDPDAARRQVAVASADGRAAAFTGSACFPHASHVVGDTFAAQGNILASPAVPDAMAAAFGATAGSLVDRLFAALLAAEAAGGERRGMESAAIVVAKPDAGYGGHDRLVDLRVDHADDPLTELAHLLELHELYFGSTDSSEWLPLDASLQEELTQLIARVPWVDGERLALAGALYHTLGWLNLERRWVGPEHIDPVVLDHLRERIPQLPTSD